MSSPTSPATAARPPVVLRPDDALVVIDVQKAFDDETVFGRRDNPDAEQNITRLVHAWQVAGRPLVRVRHDSDEPGSPLARTHPGNAFKDEVSDLKPQLDVRKRVNSAFYGTPDLHVWLSARGTRRVVVCGIQTNFCCETTARMASNLGYDMVFVLDATHTFDITTPDGVHVPAEQLALATKANLDPEFGRVVTTSDLVEAPARSEPVSQRD